MKYFRHSFPQIQQQSFTRNNSLPNIHYPFRETGSFIFKAALPYPLSSLSSSAARAVPIYPSVPTTTVLSVSQKRAFAALSSSTSNLRSIQNQFVPFSNNRYLHVAWSSTAEVNPAFFTLSASTSRKICSPGFRHATSLFSSPIVYVPLLATFVPSTYIPVSSLSTVPADQVILHCHRFSFEYQQPVPTEQATCYSISLNGNGTSPLRRTLPVSTSS